jgi:tight adherence protein B
MPEDAIVAAAERWPPLGPAAIAAELHHDIPQALSEVASLPGAIGLRDISAAWQVSGQSGSGLAVALSEVAKLLASRERQARLVDAELAAARATAIVVSGLPVLVLGMGSGLGADPWTFFLSGGGTIVMAVAGSLLLAGWAWLDRLTDQANHG